MIPKRKGHPDEQPVNTVTVKPGKDSYFTQQRTAVYAHWYKGTAGEKEVGNG